jgi:hypothetical protein
MCVFYMCDLQERGGALLGTIDINNADIGLQLLEKGLAYRAGQVRDVCVQCV